MDWDKKVFRENMRRTSPILEIRVDLKIDSQILRIWKVQKIINQKLCK